MNSRVEANPFHTNSPTNFKNLNVPARKKGKKKKREAKRGKGKKERYTVNRKKTKKSSYARNLRSKDTDTGYGHDTDMRTRHFSEN